MTRLPLISGNECIKALRKAGYMKSRQKGSHERLICSGCPPVMVSLYEELDRGTLSSILRTVHISPEEFSKLLKR